jgi:hypothetical protein
MSSQNKAEAILRGIGAGAFAFVGVEVAAAVISALIRLVEQYTHWFYLGQEWNNWLGVVFLYWAIFPAAFIALVVCARVIKSRWHNDA